MILTPSQKNVIEKLLNAYNGRLENKNVSFMAPTGSGKTFMASEFISQILACRNNGINKTIFIVATVSNAELPKQFSRKLEEYKKFHEFNDYKIEFIQSPTASKSSKFEDIKDFVLENNKVFVFGVSSFSKNTLFFQNKTLETLISDANVQGYEIIFIRDEAHIGSSEKAKIGKDEQNNFDSKMRSASIFNLEMTATPKERLNLIMLTREEMENDNVYLLKDKMEVSRLSDEVSNEQIIDEAINTFISVKKDYESLSDVVIYPAMLVQVMNESDYDVNPVKNQMFNDDLKLLEDKLKSAGLKYLKYLGTPEVVGSNLPATLEFASQIDSPIDVIIFKVGPATGWDIPRANMLLQLRSVSSESLNVQTLGRIMRNPYPGLKQNEITRKYYVWSNYQKPTREEAFYSLKSEFINKEFFRGYINQENRLIIKNKEQYHLEVLKFLDEEIFKNKIKDLVINDIVYNETTIGSAVVKQKIKNHIYLRINNIKLFNELENKYSLSLFNDKLTSIAKELNRNIELVKYAFLSFVFKLSEIHAKNSEWSESEEPYEISRDAKTLKNYSIWGSERANTKYFVNYGYKQVMNDEFEQCFDSKPELSFFQNFKNAISSKHLNDIKFFAKMPTLGSGVYFEYFSKLSGSIAKSYMDFAIEYKDKMAMVEVKSRDADYNPQKTKELANAYSIYMNKFKDKNLSLLLYEYDKTSDTKHIQMNVNGKWKEEISFRDALDYLFE